MQPAAKTVSQKMGVKKDSRAFLVHAPTQALSALHLPDIVRSSRATGEFDYIHVFVKEQEELDHQFLRLTRHLRATGMLWVSWPKAKQLNTDLNLKNIIRIGYNHGLVESKTLGIDDTWSAIKFTHPKKDKVYKNSYGKLKRHNE